MDPITHEDTHTIPGKHHVPKDPHPQKNHCKTHKSHYKENR